MPKAEDRSTEVCNWVLGDSYEVCLSSNFSLSCALVAVVFCCTLCAAPSSWRRQVCGVAQAVRVPEGKPGHIWIAILALLAVFISCQKMSCNLFLLAFVLGIGGAFQYGLQISIINSPAEVSMNSSKNWAHSKNFNVLMHSCFYLQSLTFSLLLSQLDLLWFLGSNSSCYCSCVSLCFNLSGVTELWKGRMGDIYKVSHFPIAELDCSQDILRFPVLRESFELCPWPHILGLSDCL